MTVSCLLVSSQCIWSLPHLTVGPVLTTGFFAGSQHTFCGQGTSAYSNAVPGTALLSVVNTQQQFQITTCASPALQVVPCDIISHEMRIEAELKNLLAEHRQESLGHTPTHWDDSTGFLLMPSLAAHEQDALTGQSTAQDDFQQCIRRSIPSGCTFKGFPQHHRYRVGRIGVMCSA